MEFIAKKESNVFRIFSWTTFSFNPEWRNSIAASSEMIQFVKDLVRKFKDGVHHVRNRDDEGPVWFDYFHFGTIVTFFPEKTREKIIGGQTKVIVLWLLLIYVHHRCKDPLKSELFRLLAQDHKRADLLKPYIGIDDRVAILKTCIAMDIDRASLDALLVQDEEILSYLPAGTQDLIGLFDQIERYMDSKLSNDFEALCFANWLLHDVCLDKITAFSEDGALILQKAIAFEQFF